MNLRNIRPVACALALTGVVSGCATHVQTMTARASDTYYRWNDRMDDMPFVFHLPEGRVEVFDSRGAPWAASADAVEAGHGRRVEIFLGRFAGPGASMCGGSPTLTTMSADDRGKGAGNVVAALCDQQRTVVSYIDRAKPQVLDEHPRYLSTARYLLLQGLWGATTEDTDPYS